MSTGVSPARAAAAWVLSRCRRFDAWSQQTVDSARIRFALDDRDAALCARMCLSVLQNAALCDYYIGCFCGQTPEKLEPQVLDILRLGTVQLLLMDRVPPSAAVNESVELAKGTRRRAAGLVNAVLRKIAQNITALPPIPGSGTARELSIRFSHPLWLCEKLMNAHGYDFTRAWLETNNTPPTLTVSVNLCRTDAVSLAERLCAAGFDAAVNPLSEVSVDIRDAGYAAALPGFARGDFFVQDAAAATGVTALRPEPGMRVLDACAAPGGKSMLCAGWMRDKGEILACDIHEKKLRLIEENAARLGLRSVRTAVMDAAAPEASLYEAFDLVISDVPCSGLGVIRKKPEIRYKDRGQIARLPEAQRRILDGVSRCVRAGGTLLYSTCTILSEENEAVVAAFLDDNPAFSLDSQRTIWQQDYGTDGFYYAILKKK